MDPQCVELAGLYSTGPLLEAGNNDFVESTCIWHQSATIRPANIGLLSTLFVLIAF